MDFKMEVIWSAKARITFLNVLDYLDTNWTKKEIFQFHQRTELIIRAIRKNPGIYPCSIKHKNIRKAVIDKNNSLFYSIDKENKKVYLLTFFDNRQNPNKLTFNL